MRKRTSDKRKSLVKENEAETQKVQIRQLPTGVRGLDEILGGGLPELSFNIIAGAPGCGKTTLGHQIVFANATRQKPAVYFTVLGEPALKMLRYQQQFSFFDPAKVGNAVRFVNLSDVVLEKDLGGVLEAISQEVQATQPSIVVVDSFRTVVRKAAGGESETALQAFVQQLALFMTSWEATTFLIGEYVPGDMRDNPIFTVADGLFWLTQNVERNSVARKLQIVKLRGQGSVPGLHTIRISSDGLQAFSRTMGLARRKTKPAHPRRLSTGVPELDNMMDGGLREGDCALVAGPSGTGKSTLATQFLAEGLRRGEAGIAVIFEERPDGYVARARTIGQDLEAPQKNGTLEIIYLRPLDLSVDEMMQEILDSVERVNAKRLVIDSLAGFEMALAPGFRDDFRESLYRMIVALTGAGVTIFTTVEVADKFTSLPLTHYAMSFMTDDLIRLRYVEINGQLRKVLMVVKMRGGNHSKDIREYVINNKGVVVISPRQTGYSGLVTGVPALANDYREQAPEPKAT